MLTSVQPLRSTNSQSNMMTSNNSNSENYIDLPNICLNNLNQIIAQEKNAPDFAQFLGANTMNNSLATCSGFSEQDYPNISPMENSLLNPFDSNVSPQNIRMPSELKDQMARTQCFSKLGVLPAIGDRAYLIVDSDLYLWRVKSGDDISYFDTMSESIICLNVVKPKPGVFKSHIQHILVVATATDIILLGVTIEKETGCLRLSKPLYKISTDTIHMSEICSNKDGSDIYLAGRDGSVYELIYGINKSWTSVFSSGLGYLRGSQGSNSSSSRNSNNASVNNGFITLKNHTQSALSRYLLPTLLTGQADGIVKMQFDSQRKVIYALSEKGSISLYSVEKEYDQTISPFSSTKSISHVYTLSNTNIIKTVKNSIIQATGPSAVPQKVIEGKIIGFSILPISVSRLVALQVVTSSGVRLFIALGFNETEIRTLHIAHIRLPPGLSPNAEPWKKPNEAKIFVTNSDNSLSLMVAKDRRDLNSQAKINSSNLLGGGVYEHSMGPGGNHHSSSIYQDNDQKSNQVGDVLWLFNRPTGSTLSTIISNKERNGNIKDFNIMVSMGRKESHNYTSLSSVCWTCEELSDNSLIILTHDQIFLLKSYKAVDELKLILAETRSFEGPKVENFFMKYHGTGLATSACLELICNAEELENVRGNHAQQNISFSNLAAHAFFRYSKELENNGQNPQTNHNRDFQGPSDGRSISLFGNQQNQNRNKNQFNNSSTNPHNFTINFGNQHQETELEKMVNGEKFQGIINFISKTLDPIYNVKIFNVSGGGFLNNQRKNYSTSSSSQKNDQKKTNDSISERLKITTELNESQLKSVILKLKGLKSFLESHAKSTLDICPVVDHNLISDEKILINGIYHFVCLTLEVVSFLHILVDIPSQLMSVWKRSSIDLQNTMATSMTLQWLLTRPADGNQIQGLPSSLKYASGNNPTFGIQKQAKMGSGSNSNVGISYARISGPVQTLEPLVNSLIKSYLDEGLPVENLCSKLHSQCPQLFTTDDYIAATALGVWDF